MIEWLPWLPSKSCYTNLKFFETLKDTPNPSKGFRFVAFLVLEILGGVLFDPPPLVLGVGTKTLGARRVNKFSNTGPTTAAALLNPSGTVSCTYCRKSHPSAKCQAVSDISARRNLLRKQGRCFLCLRKNHLARDCTSPSKCLNCSQLHHVSICPRLIPSINFAGQSHIAVQNQQNPGQAKGIKFKEFHPSNQSKPVNSNQQQAEVNQT